MRSRMVAIVVMAVILTVGTALVARAGGDEEQFCTLEGILADPPPPAGWDLQRDHANDCQWTLFNEAGDRAPDELYAGLPVDPPPPVPRDPSLILGTVLIVGALIGLVVSLLLPRHTSND